MNFLETMLNKYKESRRKKDIAKTHSSCLKRKYLTSWEDTFLKSIDGKLDLTDKQFSKLQEIYRSPDSPKIRGYNREIVMFDDAWEENSDPRFCEKHGVSYDDVHDFDK